jgi:hypothetical protein
MYSTIWNQLAKNNKNENKDRAIQSDAQNKTDQGYINNHFDKFLSHTLHREIQESPSYSLG